MTYLDLINAVLTRLREDTINASQVDSDPFYRVIGSHVNDAKDRVADAWQWSYQRGTDLIQFTAGQLNNTLPNSFDSHYILRRAFSSDPYTDVFAGVPPQTRMQQISVEELRRLTQGGTPVLEGQPYKFAVTGRSSNGAGAGDIQVTVFPAPDKDYTMTVDRVSHAPALVNADDVLLLPSLPVYTLATALASRERGEVGGTPTSELFAIADAHLSDAIAQDSALFATEIDWYSAGEAWANTNVRTA